MISNTSCREQLDKQAKIKNLNYFKDVINITHKFKVIVYHYPVRSSYFI